MSLAANRTATSALRSVVGALLTAGGNAPGQSGAELRRRAGLLLADAAERVEAADFADDLRTCFEAATAAGATLDGMDRVRLGAIGYDGPWAIVSRVVQTAARLALVEMCRLLAATTFASRQDAEAALARINSAFEPAETFAADRGNPVVYRAIVALHAAAVRDLTQRARQLPRLIRYSHPRRTPTLQLANRLYGDAARETELIAENRIVHPLFAPRAGVALAG